MHERFMRCLELAVLGWHVAPNLWWARFCIRTIIGEGYHKKYGGRMREVNCINSVADTDRN